MAELCEIHIKSLDLMRGELLNHVNNYHLFKEYSTLQSSFVNALPVE